jgi:hypothetical protein
MHCPAQNPVTGWFHGSIFRNTDCNWCKKQGLQNTAKRWTFFGGMCKEIPSVVWLPTTMVDTNPLTRMSTKTGHGKKEAEMTRYNTRGDEPSKEAGTGYR